MLLLMEHPTFSDSSTKKPFPISTKPPAIPVTVLQPTRISQFTHNRSPYATSRRSSLNTPLISESTTPYFSLKGSRMLKGYISPTVIPSESPLGSVKDAVLLDDQHVSRV
ncbi:hypothetical protein OESDEN_05097 [Oesophagostomum dentatum]|uniref:Uncharacterized protein n=1 Tax=Oesophagostomum dentatum TaxID=61180 RepID=A0A0B1THT2_OESDE|nr:hypothetical protein OESDEN_05097 [Oesophagostomum dentatum]